MGLVPAVLAAWVVVAGLPLGTPSTEARPGTLRHKTYSLTGDQPSAGVQVEDETGAGASAASQDSATGRSLDAAPTERADPNEDVLSPGWSAKIEVESGTQAASVAWTGDPTGAVDIRGHATDGWSDWTELHGEPGEEPDSGPAVSGDLAWFGGDGVDRVEVRVTEGSLADVKVQAMRYDLPSGGSNGLFATAVAGADSTPSIVPRSNWTSQGWATGNSGCSTGPITASGGVKFAVVHHTVNSNTYSQDDVPGMLASIYRFHTSSTASGGRGWCDIAYNFVIDRFGRAWEARSGGIANAIVGGHAAGFNTGSVGVSFLGQYEPGASPAAVAPTSAALAAAGRVIGWKLGLSGLDPNSSVTVTSSSGGSSAKYPAGKSVTIKRVSGHRDVGYTDCPGGNLYAQLASIRATATGVAAQTTPTTPGTKPTTPPPSGTLGPFGSVTALVKQQYVDLLKRNPTSSELSTAVADIEAGRRSPASLIAGLVSSSEADSKVSTVIRLYRAYFLRNPDHAGLEYWIKHRLSGWSLKQISDQFVGTPEFVHRYGSLSTAGYVDLVYRNVLGRAADSPGRSYWVGQIGSGTSRGQVMAKFSDSSEYRRTTLAGVQIVALYDGMIRRTIPQGTYDYLEPRLRTDITDTSGVAVYFFAKPEYIARIR